MIRSVDEQLTAIESLLGGLVRCVEAIRLQQGRLALATDAQGAEVATSDVDLLALAIHHVSRQVGALGDMGVPIAAAKAGFDAAFPDASTLRHVLSHPEDYLTGRGNTQGTATQACPWCGSRCGAPVA